MSLFVVFHIFGMNIKLKKIFYYLCTTLFIILLWNMIREILGTKLKINNSNNGYNQMNLTVTSSYNEVMIKKDAMIIYHVKDPSKRGIHVVVFNEIYGFIMDTNVFDCYALLSQCYELIDYINNLSINRFVVITILDEATFKINDEIRIYFTKYGSKCIETLGFRHLWIFAFSLNGVIPNKYPLAEVCDGKIQPFGWPSALQYSFLINLQPINFHLLLQHNTINNNKCPSDEKRGKFCSKYEAFHCICSCNGWPLKSNKLEPLKQNIIDSIPIIIMASNRPHYLEKTICRLLTIDGINSNKIIVFVDGFHSLIEAMADVFNITVYFNYQFCTRNCRISQHYKQSLIKAFDLNPKSNATIILEEDLLVSNDFLNYMAQMYNILLHDHTLYCISAWNDLGYNHTVSKNQSLLYRIEGMPGLGWMLSRKIYEELIKKWPNEKNYWDWDIWMRDQRQRRSRECVVPDISRTFHFGSIGLNINPIFQNVYFSNHAFYSQELVDFNTLNMDSVSYDRMLENLIQSSINVDESILNDPCKIEKWSKIQNNQSYIMYIDMKIEQNYQTWLYLAKCWRIWDLNPRGVHKYSWRLHLNTNHVIIIAFPISPFSKFKSIEQHVFEIKN